MTLTLRAPGNLEFVSKESWYVRMRIWAALHDVDFDDQNRAFKQIVGHIGERDSAFYYLRRRYRRKPSDVSHIRELLDILLSAVKAESAEEYERRLDVLANAKWSANLVKRKVAAHEDLFPDIPGGRLLFDSGGHDIIGYFDRFCAVIDNQTLWCFWEEPGNSIGACQILQKEGKSYVYSIPIENDTPNAIGDALPTKMGNNICVAYRVRGRSFGIVIVPIREHDSRLDLDKRIQLKPDIEANLDETHISALIPQNDGLFICLAHGAIYRWKQGEPKWELISSSQSLQDGPLNNCNPYYVFAGTSNELLGKDDVFFFVLGLQNIENALETYGHVRTTVSVTGAPYFHHPVSV